MVGVNSSNNSKFLQAAVTLELLQNNVYQSDVSAFVFSRNPADDETVVVTFTATILVVDNIIHAISNSLISIYFNKTVYTAYIPGTSTHDTTVTASTSMPKTTTSTAPQTTAIAAPASSSATTAIIPALVAVIGVLLIAIIVIVVIRRRRDRRAGPVKDQPPTLVSIVMYKINANCMHTGLCRGSRRLYSSIYWCRRARRELIQP